MDTLDKHTITIRKHNSQQCQSSSKPENFNGDDFKLPQDNRSVDKFGSKSKLSSKNKQEEVFSDKPHDVIKCEPKKKLFKSKSSMEDGEIKSAADQNSSQLRRENTKSENKHVEVSPETFKHKKSPSHKKSFSERSDPAPRVLSTNDTKHEQYLSQHLQRYGINRNTYENVKQRVLSQQQKEKYTSHEEMVSKYPSVVFELELHRT